jgi:RNA polymerase sigma-54 factor
MALDLRLQQKMAQQLVMTPQLQQAIKLLQLSHLEMAEVLREEMEQNPVLEDRGDGAEDIGPEDADFEPVAAADDAGGAAEVAEAGGVEADMGVDLTSASDAPVDATPEPNSADVDRDTDWENYLDSYSYALPATAGGAGGEELPPFEATLTKSTSLVEHLRWQVQMLGLTAAEVRIAALLIEEINDDGYLAADAVELVVDELGVLADAVEDVLLALQELDPPGVAARNLRECLLIQAARLAQEDPLVHDIIDRHLPHVERRNIGAIARDLKVSPEEVSRAVRVITGLEPRPGRIYSDREPQYITPDIYVYKVGAGSDDYVITLNEEGLPRLRISSYYRDAMQSFGGQTKSYIQEKLRSAAWLIRSIHMRQRTIYRVVESILKFQRDFFDRGVAHLKPLILKDVADDVGMHESTISRVTTNKYVHTPQGIYELKFFFNSSISRVDGDSIASESVRNHIERLIREEDSRAPHSDQRIVEILKAQDIDIARRTVAKYREMLKIPSSSKRKRVF